MALTRREFLIASAALAPAAGNVRAAGKTLCTVAQTLPGVATVDGAGVALTRVIGQRALRDFDPWVMLDRFHSDDPSAYIAGFPDHPHRGIETITVMLHGRMLHKDSRGNSGLITGGGSQWMTAGRGIVHSETPQQESGLMSGFQLWLNLPAREKMRDPAYQDLKPSAISEASFNGQSKVRLFAGRAFGVKGPVAARSTEPVLMHLSLEDDRPAEVDVPKGHNSFVFVHEGAVDVGETTVNAGNIALLSSGDTVRVRAKNQRSALLLASAKPIREPIVHGGPFVMNTEEEIRQAFQEYRAGTLVR